MFDNRIDLSLQNITIGELKDRYGTSILNKRVTLYANEDGTIVDGYTYSGKLSKILKDDIYGDFFYDRQVLLIEEVDGTIYIDYKWDKEELESLVRWYMPYDAQLEYTFINREEEITVSKGRITEYQKFLDYFSSLNLSELLNTLLNNVWRITTLGTGDVGYLIDTRTNPKRTDDIYRIGGTAYLSVNDSFINL